MRQQELRKHCLQMMQTVPAVILSTVDKRGMPFSRALENLRNPKQYPDLAQFFKPYLKNFTTFFGTNASSKKIKHIKDNPKVAAYYCHPKEYRGMMLGGKIEIITDKKIKHAIWQDGWETYYPEGRDDPDFTVLRLKPTIVRGWWPETMTIFEFKP